MRFECALDEMLPRSQSLQVQIAPGKARLRWIDPVKVRCVSEWPSRRGERLPVRVREVEFKNAVIGRNPQQVWLERFQPMIGWMPR